VRLCVVDRRITQGTRRESGQRYHERKWTVIATCDKQGRSFFRFRQASPSLRRRRFTSKPRVVPARRDAPWVTLSKHPHKPRRGFTTQCGHKLGPTITTWFTCKTPYGVCANVGTSQPRVRYATLGFDVQRLRRKNEPTAVKGGKQNGLALASSSHQKPYGSYFGCRNE